MQRQRRSETERAGEAAEGLLDAHEAAAFLRVKLSTIRQWTYQRRLPVVKLFGREARYRRRDLESLIADSTRPALAEYEGSRP